MSYEILINADCAAIKRLTFGDAFAMCNNESATKIYKFKYFALENKKKKTEKHKNSNLHANVANEYNFIHLSLFDTQVLV